PYHHWSEVPPDVRDIWWGEFQVNKSNIVVDLLCLNFCYKSLILIIF
ncbi:hypothetical protein M8044_000551, partial [Columbia Basin potato purple top phytoplasma]|nr:hypothetical protein [Columbia Basin potato purple top phytoplasma]